MRDWGGSGLEANSPSPEDGEPNTEWISCRYDRCEPRPADFGTEYTGKTCGLG